MFGSSFAKDIFKQKYSKDGKEEWADTCRRVVESVCPTMPGAEKLLTFMIDRKFIPGGRYLYAAGRDFHQVNNCLAGEERIVTDQGIFSLRDLAGKEVTILNRFGKWETATVQDFGKQRLYEIVFTDGNKVLATANHRWWQTDNTRVTTLDLKVVPKTVMDSFPELDEEGIQHGIIYGDGYLNAATGYCEIVFVNKEKDSSLADFFPFKEIESIGGGGARRIYPNKRQTKAGVKVGFLPSSYKSLPSQCSPEYARGFIAGLIATDGHVAKRGSVTIACEGIEKAKGIAEIATLAGCVVSSVYVNSKVNVFNGQPRELCFVSIKPFSAPVLLPSHKANLNGRKFYRRKLVSEVASIKDTGREEIVYCAVVSGSESFTLANGLATSNCFLFRADDSREGWASLMQRITASLMTGGGIGVDYTDIRPEGAPIKRTGGTCTGPLALMHMVNEAGRFIMQGGQRRSAIWAGLGWNHPDVHKFIHLKDWSEDLRNLKNKDFTFPAPMELTNISVNYDTAFFVAIEDSSHPQHEQAKKVWLDNCHQAFRTAEPGMAFNFLKDRESLRNACTEVTSEDDSDKCNLGTVWINRCSSRDEFAEVVRLATTFLLYGGLYSDVPTEEIRAVGAINNRIGLGLGGIHEWLMRRDSGYTVTPELHKWLNVYEQESEAAAYIGAKQLGVNKPKGIRAIAPTGTIGIIAETTTGIEPLFCKAYKRRYFKDGTWYYQYVVDGSVKRLMSEGVKLEAIQDAYDISFKDRVKFQADIQNYVDMAISSTCNMTPWGSDANSESTLKKNSDTLLKYAKRLRGFTCYPDGARGGQPLTPIGLEEALSQEGTVFSEGVDICDLTKGGTCGG